MTRTPPAHATQPSHSLRGATRPCTLALCVFLSSAVSVRAVGDAGLLGRFAFAPAPLLGVRTGARAAVSPLSGAGGIVMKKAPKVEVGEDGGEGAADFGKKKMGLLANIVRQKRGGDARGCAHPCSHRGGVACLPPLNILFLFQAVGASWSSSLPRFVQKYTTGAGRLREMQPVRRLASAAQPDGCHSSPPLHFEAARASPCAIATSFSVDMVPPIAEPGFLPLQSVP